jgi:hypothetical protein
VPAHHRVTQIVHGLTDHPDQIDARLVELHGPALHIARETQAIQEQDGEIVVALDHRDEFGTLIGGRVRLEVAERGCRGPDDRERGMWQRASRHVRPTTRRRVVVRSTR